MGDVRVNGKGSDFSRRNFLKGAAVGAVAVGLASAQRPVLGADASPAPSAVPDPLSPTNIDKAAGGFRGSAQRSLRV